ncbi:MAG: DNA polymerase III subunit [Actinobacteria bacterium]|nr:DNA polymerase III subunit [Actinomycetota bacterium]
MTAGLLAANLIGHGEVVELLQHELAKPSHAYLFVGPAGVGKATVARDFARLLLCPIGGDHVEPCRSCRRIASGNHPDLVLVEPEGRASLGVETARSVVSQAVLSPVESERRVFLAEDAGTMTEQAANALLKTLEEPTAAVTFLLVSESEDDFPLTLASRCRVVRFGRVPEDELTAELERQGLAAEEARVLALVSGGRPGLALQLGSEPQVADLRQAWLNLPSRLSGRPGDSFRLAEEMIALIEPLASELAGTVAGGAEQRDRAKRRATQSLLASGLEILASFYLDSASLQLGGPIRNRDVALSELARVSPAVAVNAANLILDAVVDLIGNLRPLPLLAALFTSLE